MGLTKGYSIIGSGSGFTMNPNPKWIRLTLDSIELQADLNNIQKWSEQWQMKFNRAMGNLGTILLIRNHVKPTSACTSGDALFRMYSFVTSFFSRLDKNCLFLTT